MLIGGKNDGWPIDWSPRADSVRASVIAWNDSVARINREIMRENMMNRANPPKELHKLKEEPALFYREMCEAGILGVIQSSEVPIRALYDRKNLDRLTLTTFRQYVTSNWMRIRMRSLQKWPGKAVLSSGI